jgi:hypothetical protein
VAGSPLKQCYWQICLMDHPYKAHRLAWLLTHGEPVPDTLDHIDGNGANNRISNLRAATPEESNQNRRTPRNSTTGTIGVTLRSTRNGRPFYEVRVAANRKRHLVGFFATLDEAIAARKEAAKRLHGEFSPYD